MAKSKNEYNEATAIEAPKKKKGKVNRMTIKKGKKGGHVITHHHEYQPGMIGGSEDEDHVFGKDEGDEALKHIAKHMGMKTSSVQEHEPDEEARNEEGEGEPGSAAKENESEAANENDEDSEG